MQFLMEVIYINNKDQIEKINKEEIEKIFSNYGKSYKTKVSLDKKKKYIFTIKKFEVFFRLYVNENIQVYIRTNTLNSKEISNYEFVNFNEVQITNIDEYRKNVKLFFKNIIKEVNNTFYCPEYHREMIPDNATKEETDKGWYNIYEQRLLMPLSYNNQNEFNEWIEKVSNKKYVSQQKSYNK